MDNNGQKPGSQPCGPDCTCNATKGLSMKSRTIFLTIIIVAAGAALSSSLIRKSRSAVPATKSGYSDVLPLDNNAAALLSGARQGTVSETKPAGENISFTPLSSLASLDTVAQNVDGVFILLVNSDADRTPAMQKEIAAATNTLASRGTRAGVYQLAQTTPDFVPITTQMPAPGVLVIVKGRGMRGVQGSDITETKLLQAWIAAMQPTSCCPAGGKRVCK
jgi:hypothetical protein